MDSIDLMQEQQEKEAQNKISSNEYVLKQRNLTEETKYLKEDDLIDLPMNKDGENTSIAEIYFNKYIQNTEDESVSYENKKNKYKSLLRKGNKEVNVFAGKYNNHKESKRKGKFEDAVKHYEKASKKYKELANREDTTSKEYISASVAVLKERLAGMISAAEAKSYSDIDEKLRKAAATVKIYSAIVYAYSMNADLFNKEIAKANDTLKKAKASYNKYKVKNEEEKLKVLDRTEIKNGAVRLEKKEENYQQQLDNILSGKKADFIPDNLVYHTYTADKGKKGRIVKKNLPITLKTFNLALRLYNLNKKINNTPSEMDKSFSNIDSNRTIVQTVISAFRKHMFTQPKALSRFVENTSSNFKKINNYLRNKDKKKDENDIEFLTLHIEEEGKEDAELLVEAFADEKIKLDYDIVVNRGVDNNAIEGLIGAENYNPERSYAEQLPKGTIITDKGIVSTSVLPGHAFSKDCKMVILCKKGTHAVNISHGNGSVADEEELTIAPGTKYRVINCIQNTEQGKTKTTLYLETIVNEKTENQTQSA